MSLSSIVPVRKLGGRSGLPVPKSALGPITKAAPVRCQPSAPGRYPVAASQQVKSLGPATSVPAAPRKPVAAHRAAVELKIVTTMPSIKASARVVASKLMSAGPITGSTASAAGRSQARSLPTRRPVGGVKKVVSFKPTVEVYEAPAFKLVSALRRPSAKSGQPKKSVRIAPLPASHKQQRSMVVPAAPSRPPAPRLLVRKAPSIVPRLTKHAAARMGVAPPVQVKAGRKVDQFAGEPSLFDEAPPFDISCLDFDDLVDDALAFPALVDECMALEYAPVLDEVDLARPSLFDESFDLADDVDDMELDFSRPSLFEESFDLVADDLDLSIELQRCNGRAIPLIRIWGPDSP